MTTNQQHDNDIEATLQRAAGYLARRGSEYLEHPVRTTASHQDAPRRYRRVLVGTAAAVTLCVTALVGSFIGGTSSGKVDVAEAAWSAIPATPTAEQVKKVQLDCGITNETMAAIEGVTLGTAEPSRLEPALVDVRGTTTTAVYFTPTHAVLCSVFSDGSVSIKVLPMGPNDGNGGNGWKTPGVIVVKIDGNNGPEPFTATMIVGYLPDGENWDVYIKVDGIETVEVAKSAKWARYVAWIPGEVSGEVAFVNTSTGEERYRPFVRGVEAPWQMSPVTTVPYAPSN